MGDPVRRLWAEPRVPNPPPPQWWDWALVAVLVPVAVLEGVLRDDLVWPVTSVVLVVALLPTLLWRRTHPLATAMVAFGTIAITEAASLTMGVDWEGLGTAVFVLLLPYALLRWGSGREVVVGLGVVLVPVVLSTYDATTSTGDVIGGALFMLSIAAVGAAVRYQDAARLRGMDQIKLLEREQLARELHDTVAHHVSAIAVRAQAGQIVAASDPDAARDALAVIEEEASRTLAEMRTMVGALRQGEEPDLTPQRGVFDIERLADPTDRPRVEVALSGDLDGLRPSVDAALYRLAQESITNARRHARHATRVSVSVSGEEHWVRLAVRDDGDAGPADVRSSVGFGLVGMAERARLLGGTLEAGPVGPRGWTVEAALPRGGGA